MTLNQEQIMNYFTRIGLNYDDYKCHKLDGQLLAKLCFAHNISIPFENLDILNHKMISLDGSILYDKKSLQSIEEASVFELNGLSEIFFAIIGIWGKRSFFQIFSGCRR